MLKCLGCVSTTNPLCGRIPRSWNFRHTNTSRDKHTCLSCNNITKKLSLSSSIKPDCLSLFWRVGETIDACDTCVVRYKSHKNQYNFRIISIRCCTSPENPYQVLQVTGAMSERALKWKDSYDKIINYYHSTKIHQKNIPRLLPSALLLMLRTCYRRK